MTTPEMEFGLSVAMRWHGVWDASEDYYGGSVVEHTDILWVGHEDGVSGEPGTEGSGWDRLTSTEGTPGPEGPAGPKGDLGDRGLQGVAGSTGATGDRGAPGAKGDKGDRGDAGPSGATIGRMLSTRFRQTVPPNVQTNLVPTTPDTNVGFEFPSTGEIRVPDEGLYVVTYSIQTIGEVPGETAIGAVIFFSGIADGQTNNTVSAGARYSTSGAGMRRISRNGVFTVKVITSRSLEFSGQIGVCRVG